MTDNEAMTLYFDDDQKPVQTCDPREDVDDEIQGSRHRREIISRLLGWTVQGSTSPEQIGRRLLLLAFIIRAPEAPASQRELARRLKVSEAAVSKQVKRFRAVLAGM